MSQEQPHPPLDQLLREENRLIRFIQKNTHLSAKLAPEEQILSTQEGIDLTVDIRLGKIRKLREHAGRASSHATTHLTTIQTEMEIFSEEAISRTIQYNDQLVKSEAQLERARSLARYLAPETLESHEIRFRDDQNQAQQDPYILYGSRLLEQQKQKTPIQVETNDTHESTNNDKKYSISLPQSDTKLPIRELRKAVPVSLPDGEIVAVLDDDVTMALKTLTAIYEKNPLRTITESDLLRNINSISPLHRDATTLEELIYRLRVGTERWKLTSTLETQSNGKKVKRYKLDQYDPQPTNDQPVTSDTVDSQIINPAEKEVVDPEQAERDLSSLRISSLFNAAMQMPELNEAISNNKKIQLTLARVNKKVASTPQIGDTKFDAQNLRMDELIRIAQIHVLNPSEKQIALANLVPDIRHLTMWLEESQWSNFLGLVHQIYYDTRKEPKYLRKRTQVFTLYPHLQNNNRTK